MPATDITQAFVTSLYIYIHASLTLHIKLRVLRPIYAARDKRRATWRIAELTSLRIKRKCSLMARLLIAASRAVRTFVTTKTSCRVVAHCDWLKGFLQDEVL